ncbi:MAG: hypothetical protein R3181_08640 [Rubricoccaceae bacterium]|nr:hypothetical protein [Rubricoccaceae bacterium]
MSAPIDRAKALAASAQAWRDPSHPARADAAERTLRHNDLYTAEALAFAVNQAMHEASESALRRWIGDRHARASTLVGVWTEDPEPLAGWRELLALALCGHRGAVRLPPTSPFLLPAFVAEVRAHDPTLDVRFEMTWDEVPAGTTLVLGSGSEEAMAALGSLCDRAGIPDDRRRLRGERITVAVTDGRESPDERIGLAEDALLHADARRRVGVLWAPEDHSPDPVLDALAGFRELFPAPPPLGGRLQMPRAFLQAAGTAHAWGEGFLVSKGPPEPQPAGHLRWAEYRTLGDVGEWLRAHPVELVVVSDRLRSRLGWTGRTAAPGDAHRPHLGGDDFFDLLGLR